MAINHSIKVTKTARFFTLKEPTYAENSIWIVLHGYQQLARYFIHKFDSVDTENKIFYAPEGLHRFYIKGSGGRVVASWMTSEDREDDINDYVNFLDDFLSEILQNHANNPKINILGFSQGGATAVRWLCNGKSKINQLVLWAGSFPNDIDLSNGITALRNTDIKLVIGENDPFVTKKHVRSLENFLNKHQVDHKTLWFDGVHEIDPKTLKEIVY